MYKYVYIYIYIYTYISIYIYIYIYVIYIYIYIYIWYTIYIYIYMCIYIYIYMNYDLWYMTYDSWPCNSTFVERRRRSRPSRPARPWPTPRPPRRAGPRPARCSTWPWPRYVIVYYIISYKCVSHYRMVHYIILYYIIICYIRSSGRRTTSTSRGSPHSRLGSHVRIHSMGTTQATPTPTPENVLRFIKYVNMCISHILRHFKCWKCLKVGVGVVCVDPIVNPW